MKRSFLFYFLLFLLWLPIMGCNVAPSPHLQEDTSTPVPEAMETEEVADESVDPATLHLSARHSPLLPSQGLQVTRKAQVEFKVEDYGRSSKAIEAAVTAHKGYIERGNESRSGQRLENMLSIRVPAPQFDALLSSLLSQSYYLVEKTITATEVGEEMADMTARLKSKKAVEQRYLDLLKQSNTIKEIMELENQLRGLREEIEASEARLQHLQSQVAYSTINLRYYEPIPAVSPPDQSFFFRLAGALGEGWKFLELTVIGLAFLWPFLILSLLAWVMMRLQANRKKVLGSGPFPPGT